MSDGRSGLSTDASSSFIGIGTIATSSETVVLNTSINSSSDSLISVIDFSSSSSGNINNRATNKSSSHICHLCGYVARDKTNLRKHLYTHTGEKPYQCKVCQYKTTQSSNLHTHNRRHHPSLNLDVVSSPPHTAIGGGSNIHRSIQSSSLPYNDTSVDYERYCNVAAAVAASRHFSFSTLGDDDSSASERQDASGY